MRYSPNIYEHCVVCMRHLWNVRVYSLEMYSGHAEHLANIYGIRRTPHLRSRLWGNNYNNIITISRRRYLYTFPEDSPRGVSPAKHLRLQDHEPRTSRSPPFTCQRLTVGCGRFDLKCPFSVFKSYSHTFRQ